MKLLKHLSVVSIFLLLPDFCPGGVISQQLQEQLKSGNPGEMHKVILVTAEQADIYTLDQQLTSQKATLAQRNYQVITALQEVTTRTQPPVLTVINKLETQGEVKNVKSFWLANLIAIEATEEAIQSLAGIKEVAKITIDYPIELIKPVEEYKSEKPDHLITSVEVGLERVHAPEAWALGYTGAGRVVANIDTGVDGSHPALTSRFRGDVDGDGDNDESWYDLNAGTDFPVDQSDHGTHTMGTICGRSPYGDTIGVAIDAIWIAASPDFYNSLNQFVSHALLAFQWIADPDGDPTTQDNPDAVGNSWGLSPFIHDYPHCDETFWFAIDNVEAAGTVVIFSAGNEGSYGANSLRTPADRETTLYNVFSVGSVNGNNPNLPISDFSSRGPTYCTPDGSEAYKPEVVAPGESVRSSVPGGDYAYKSGTSMASPHITGAVAVLRQVNPNLDANTIKEILMTTAEDLGSLGEDNDYGHGIINLYQACLLAEGYGNVDGYITDANTSDPLPARIGVVGSQFETYADISGYYSLGLPADTTFTLEASYYGYLPHQQSVYIIADDTVHQDFALSPAPSAILQGTVTSIDSDSISGAEVTILDTPIPPEATDANGFYQFPVLPSGSSYWVQVRAIGYSQELDSIYIQDGVINVLDFSLWPAETFEYSNGGYSGEGIWQWGEPTYGPPGAWSGVKVWGTILNGEYPNNADDNLISPEVFLASSGARLEFHHWYDIEYSWDGGNVAISTNSGISWTVITPDGGYPDMEIYAFGNNEPGYTGSSLGWTLASFDLSPYYNQDVMFRWRFGSDNYVTEAGWYIDDVVITGTIPAEPPELSYNPTSFNVTTQPGNIETRDLNIINGGNGPLFFTLWTETDNPIRFNNGQKTILSTQRPEPVGFHKADTGKSGAIEEPYFPPIITDQGGPDNFGYKWIDSDEAGGPIYSWVDISGIGTPVYLGVDDHDGPIPIGFSFPFYENNYSSLYICSNGMLTFSGGSTVYINTDIPNSSNPNNMIAIWWDDLNPAAGGDIYYYYDGDNGRFIVSFVGIPNYYSGGGTGSLTFQAILYPGGKITLQYGIMNPGSDSDGLQGATIGIENAGGTDGLEVVYNALYMHNNLAIDIYSSWLSAFPASGNVDPHDSIIATIMFDATMLDEGTYTGNINLESNDPNNPDVDIPVSLVVEILQVAIIELNVEAIYDTVLSGSSSDFELLITNIGTLDLQYDIVDDQLWIEEDPDSGVVVPSTTDTVTITFDASSLDPGTYNGTVTVNSNDANQPQIDIPVELEVIVPQIPNIQLSTYSFNDTVGGGDILIRELIISNTGNGTLNYTLSDDCDWLSENPDSGQIDPGGQQDTIDIIFDATNLYPGTYDGTITVNSNDPDSGTIDIPVLLYVFLPGGCDYLPGDVNSDGSVMGNDVTFSVLYFKGTGLPPPDSCWDDSLSSWLYAAGDVNGNCQFTGSDVTFLVSYFKGFNPELFYCHRTPPIVNPLTPPAVIRQEK